MLLRSRGVPSTKDLTLLCDFMCLLTQGVLGFDPATLTRACYERRRGFGSGAREHIENIRRVITKSAHFVKKRGREGGLRGPETNRMSQGSGGVELMWLRDSASESVSGLEAMMRTCPDTSLG